MNNDIHIRILKVRNYNSLNQKDFADKTGVSESSIKKYEKGSSMPGGAFFLGLAQNFPDINLRWLLLGEEPMIIENQSTLESRVKELEAAMNQMQADYLRLFNRVDALAKRN